MHNKLYISISKIIFFRTVFLKMPFRKNTLKFVVTMCQIVVLSNELQNAYIHIVLKYL